MHNDVTDRRERVYAQRSTFAPFTLRVSTLCAAAALLSFAETDNKTTMSSKNNMCDAIEINLVVH